MKISVEDINNNDARLVFQAEGEAEDCQLREMKGLLSAHGADWYPWSDMSDGRGIVVVVQKKLNRK